MNDELRLNNEDRIAGNGGGNRPRRARRILVLVVLIAFVSVVWYAFSQGQQMGISQVTPVIKADAEPYKVKPDQPGGMEIPHQDKLVYDQIQGGGDAANQPEKLVPAPEQPIEPAPKSTTPAPLDLTQIPATNDAPITAIDKTTKPAGAMDGEKPPESLDLPPAKEVKPVPKVTPQPADHEPIVPANAKKPDGAKSEIVKSDAKKPDAAKTDEKPAAATGAHRVQLASLPDKGAAEKALANFKSKFASDFAGHEFTVRAANIPGKGIFYRVQIGGFSSKESAKAACDTLKSKGQGCLYAAQ